MLAYYHIKCILVAVLTQALFHVFDITETISGLFKTKVRRSTLGAAGGMELLSANG